MSINDYKENSGSEQIVSYLAKVTKVFKSEDDFADLDEFSIKNLMIENDDKTFNKKDIRFLGAITFKHDTPFSLFDFAFPFDKNNITYPITGETVLILELNKTKYWLPFSIGLYPNFRREYKTSVLGKERVNDSKGKPSGNSEKLNDLDSDITYPKNEKIKFLKPRDGDTILSGRVGNTIRFSEFFLNENDKTPSAGIFIRNGQDKALDVKPTGTLVDEDINKDGTSVYITSNKMKVPFKETTKKQKVAFKDYPSSEKLTGDQLFVNSDRIVLSAKASEFIIFGKGNTGIITDGRFTVDASKDIYMHSDSDIICQTKKNVIINSTGGGAVYIGKFNKPGPAAAEVQRMVLGGELVKLLGEVMDELGKMVFATPVGPTSAGPHNVAVFQSIKERLSTIQSSTNFLSK